MSRKKKRKQNAPAPFLSGFMRRYRKWPRRIGIVGGLVGVVVAVILLTDPFAGPAAAIDRSTGEEVKAGIIEGQPFANPRSGSPAPNFLLPDYDQWAVRLSDYQDKVVFVNFWASWCKFCETEMPDIMRIAREFPDDIVVIEINRGESKSTAINWVEARDFPQDLPNVVWILDEREIVTKEYRVDGMPQSFVIDRGGQLLTEIRRVTEYDEILEAVGPYVELEVSSATN